MRARAAKRPRRERTAGFGGGFLSLLFKITGLALFLAAIGIGLVYVRLQHGDISLNFARDLVASAVSNELAGRPVTVEDLALSQPADGGLSFVMRNVTVRDTDGAPIAAMPQAEVAISRGALMRGRVAVRRVDLVAPRLQVFYSESGALSLRFERRADTPPAGSPRDQRRGADAATVAAAQPSDTAVPATAAGSSGRSAGIQQASEPRSLDLLRILADVSGRARRREDTSSYLRFIGLKNAVVVVDNGQRKSVWNVTDGHIDLDHKTNRSRIAGQATIESLTGPWTARFTSDEVANSDLVEMTLAVDGLNPRGLGRMVPSWSALEGLDVPVSAEAVLVLPIAGGINNASVKVEIGRGRAQFGGPQAPFIDFYGGAVEGRFAGETGRLDLAKADFSWAGGEVALMGAAVRKPMPDRAMTYWPFEVATTSGKLIDMQSKADAKIEQLVMRGTAVPLEERVVLDLLQLRAAGAEISLKGDVSTAGNVPRVTIDGRIAPMTAQSLHAIWPVSIAPGARTWMRDHLRKGQTPGGTFRIVSQGGPTALDPTAPVEMKTSMTLEATGVELSLVGQLPPLEIPRALVRIEGGAAEITATDASVLGSENRRVSFKGVRLTAVETAPGDQPTAEVAFRVQGSLGAVAELADRDGLALFRSAGFALPSLDGKIDGALKLTMPLGDNVQLSEIRNEGKIAVTDVRAKNVFANLDINGGKFAIDLNDRSIDVKGDLLAKGVPAKINWQYLTNLAAERQPPLRLTMMLDNADRTALGLDVADVVQGETPVEVTVQREAKGDLATKVRIDLTKAEVMIDSINWRKAPGRAATFQFDAAKGPGTGAAARIELQNVKFVGDDAAIEGWMAIGPDNKLREMAFPNFSVNVVTRLDVQGKKRLPENVWEITARGKTFDGKDVFRALFDLGQASEKFVAKDKPGLDLDAEIETVIGFSDTSLRNVKIKASKRNEKLTALNATGVLEGNKPFVAELAQTPQGRQLRAQSMDAGQTFKLVGFYPNAVGGEMKLQVDLDARCATEKSGILWTRNFAVLGDPIVSEVLQSADNAPSSTQGGPKKRVVRSQFDFDVMGVPFAIGPGNFVMNEAFIRGPLIGASWRGKVDFRQRLLQVGGTYVPAAGLNSALGAILGPLTGGAQGDGLLGITFAVQGAIANPQVIVNPFSLVAPGIFREIFQMTPESYRLNPCADASTPAAKAPVNGAPRVQPTPAQQRPGGTVPRRAPTVKDAQQVAPGWSADVNSAGRTN